MEYNNYDETLANLKKEVLIKFKAESEKFINSFNWNALETIKKKSIDELTEHDLSFMGFERLDASICDEYHKYLYDFQNLTGGKTYYNRKPGKFEKLGFRLSLLKNITTTIDLINESILRDKLHFIE